MVRLHPHIALLCLATRVISISISERGFNAATIDGKDVPTTTDFPSPQTTDENSDIANTYTVDEYKYQFHKDPDDPSAPEFIAWAYSNFPEYMGQYADCENRESTYKALLATFIPETPSVTSTRTGASSATTGTGQAGNSDSGNGSEPQKGGARRVTGSAVLVLVVVAAAHIVMGYSRIVCRIAPIV
ncbi:hypothetical protein DFH09DRAFT_1307567 [Mycena vulgaris]|nr:hypothetical protein DFH09DRAFT_1307567 [Mycena vulgaris]